MEQSVLDSLKSLKEQINWGEYIVNQFYFKLYTGKSLSQIPSYDFDRYSFSTIDQLKLQNENFIALFHEYIHYIHETTTMTGMVSFTYEVYKRALFSNYVDIPNSSDFLGIGDAHKDYAFKIDNTTSALIGHTNFHLKDREVIEVTGYVMIDFAAHAPYENSLEEIPMKIPMVTYRYRDVVNNQIAEDTLLLGKYFLYEGLASELDKVVQEKVSGTKARDYRASEYNILKLLTYKLCPGLDKHAMLRAASLSLSSFDAAFRFVDLLEQLSQSTDIEASLKRYSDKLVNSMVLQLAEVQEEMDGIREVFSTRVILHSAMDFLMQKMMDGMRHRISNPTFEVDLAFAGSPEKLVDIIPICDYMYVFDDENEYMRDFLGTNQSLEIAYDLKILMCHIHYYHSKIQKAAKNVRCPMFTCCNVSHRTDFAELCQKTPWKIFDKVHHENLQHCPYSYGVAYMRATNA